MSDNQILQEIRDLRAALAVVAGERVAAERQFDLAVSVDCKAANIASMGKWGRVESALRAAIKRLEDASAAHHEPACVREG